MGGFTSVQQKQLINYDLKNNNFVLPIEKYIKKLEEKKESE